MSARRGATAGMAETDWDGIEVTRTSHRDGDAIFSQGEAAGGVLYVESGAVRLSVVSSGGKEGIVAVLEPGSFFGEGCLAGQPRRTVTATAQGRSRTVAVERSAMTRALRRDPAFAERFLGHMLDRNIRIEQDLIDQLFNPAEKRLARVLLLLTRRGEPGQAHRVLPRISQELLAEMVGTTRSRVNFFMNKFRKLGFIDYASNARVQVNHALLGVMLRD